MNISYKTLEYIIFAEFGAVALILVATYLLKFYFYLKHLRNQQLKIKIDDYFHVLLKNNQHKKKFPKSWYRIDLLLPKVLTLDKKKTSNWLELRKKLFKEVLLPQARKDTFSLFWLKRYMAVQCFLQNVKVEDEDYFISLITDRVPIVALNAIPLAIKSGSNSAINTIIDKISKERRLAQGIYLKEFENSQTTVLPVIEERLKTEKDPYVRATCYRILRNFPKKYTLSLSLIKKDIHSKTLELQLNTIKYMSHLQKKVAEPILKDLIKNKTWQVRVAAIHALADFKDKKYIPEIAHSLEDPVWWVRFNSATALTKFGEEGVKVLETRDPNKDLYAYEAAQHVLQVNSIDVD